MTFELPKRGIKAPPAKVDNLVKPLTRVAFGKPTRLGEGVVITGTGGIGKTSLAYMAPGPVGYADLENSLGVLGYNDALTLPGVNTWADLRAALQAPGWDDIKTIVIDSATRAEQLCAEYVLATVPHEKGHAVYRIEDYGFGKGYQYIYEEFERLLGDLDAHRRAGRHVVLIAHECVADVPNPQGEDYIRYEPRLQAPKSGKASIRARVKEWADHLLMLCYDVDVRRGDRNTRNKATANDTRVIWPTEQPFCMAKSRTLFAPIVYHAGSNELWVQMGLTEPNDVAAATMGTVPETDNE